MWTQRIGWTRPGWCGPRLAWPAAPLSAEFFTASTAFAAFTLTASLIDSDWKWLKYKNPEECINLYKLWDFHKRRRTVYKFERCHTPKRMIEHDVLKWGPKKLGLQRRTHYLGMRIKLWQKQIEGLGWGFESAPNMVWCSIILLVSSRNKNHLFKVQRAGSITIICDPTSSAVWQGKSYVLTCLEHIKSSLNW
jgi:hypothetical protein